MADGDKNAFGEIYEELKNPVFISVYRLVGNRETAEDITHDVFIKMYTGASKEIKNPKAWVFKMAHNAALDSLRKKQSEELNDDAVPIDTFDNDIARIGIESAMSKLEKEERETVSLHINAGMSFKEIADIAGISIPSVYRRYRKALNKLKNELNGGME